MSSIQIISTRKTAFNMIVLEEAFFVLLGVTANKGISAILPLDSMVHIIQRTEGGKEWSSILIQRIRALLSVTSGDKKQRLQLQSRYHGRHMPNIYILC